MANFLLTAERTTFDWLLEYLNGAGLEKPIDEKVVDELSKHHATFGYDSEVKLREDFRDTPFTTLIQIIINLDDRV